MTNVAAENGLTHRVNIIYSGFIHRTHCSARSIVDLKQSINCLLVEIGNHMQNAPVHLCTSLSHQLGIEHIISMFISQSNEYLLLLLLFCSKPKMSPNAK